MASAAFESDGYRTIAAATTHSHSTKSGRQNSKEELSSRLWKLLELLWYHEPTHELYGMQWQASNEYEAHGDGEYACYSEDIDSPPMFELFDLLPRSLTHLSIIIDQLHAWRVLREKEKSDDSVVVRKTFEEHLEHALQHMTLEIKEKEADAIKKMWKELKECDICVVPSVLILNSFRSANEWYDRLLTLEVAADLTVFPKIEVEALMENKEIYLTHLMRAEPYVAIDIKLQQSQQQTQHTPASTPLTTASTVNSNANDDERKESNQTHSTAPAASSSSSSSSTASSPPLSPRFSSSSSLNPFMHSDRMLPSVACRVYWDDPTNKDRVPFFYDKHNTLLPPTIIVNRSVFEKMAADTQTLFIKHLIGELNRHIEQEDWDVTKNVYVVKGCTSTRTNVLKRCRNAEEVKMTMVEMMKKGMKLCGAQSYLILQPDMKGLNWEARTFFNKGQFQFFLVNDQADYAVNQTFVHPQSVKKEESISAFKAIDLRGTGNDRITCRELACVQPQLIDFSIHILKQCESHCRLVSESGILRVDLGSEFRFCPSDMNEEEFRQRQKRPSSWQLTGEGFIVRLFLNEVTSTLDINWFSQQTNFPIVYSAAYATAQHLLQQLNQRQRIKDHTILIEPLPPILTQVAKNALEEKFKEEEVRQNEHDEKLKKKQVRSDDEKEHALLKKLDELNETLDEVRSDSTPHSDHGSDVANLEDYDQEDVDDDDEEEQQLYTNVTRASPPSLPPISHAHDHSSTAPSSFPPCRSSSAASSSSLHSNGISNMRLHEPFTAASAATTARYDNQMQERRKATGMATYIKTETSQQQQRQEDTMNDD